MDFLDSVKELYNSMEQDTAPCLEYCKFAPNIDDTTLEHDLNYYAEKEEPAAIICLAKVKSDTGFFASILGNAVDNFLFTEQTLYIGQHGFKFGEISSITYQKETTSSLFGKQKQKNYLVVDKKSGGSEKFGGGIAAESLARLLDGIVRKNKENPPAEKPQKEFPRSKMIADSLRTANFSKFQIAPNLDEKKINSLIIHFGKSESKASFIASYKKELFFSNDNLYSSVGEFKKIPYNQLSRAIYEENEKRNPSNEIIIEKKISLLSSEGNVFFENTKEIARKDVADFFNKIISDATGIEVKTEIQETKVERTKAERYRPVANIVRNAFSKGSLSLYKNDESKRLVGIDYSYGDDAINELYDQKYGIKASFLHDRFYFPQGNEWKCFEYTSISKIILRGCPDAYHYIGLKLILFNMDGEECFCKKLPLSLAEEVANLIAEVALELKGTEIKIEYVDEIFCIGGDVVSDDETKKKNWDLLYGKWNEIFSREIPIEYRKFTESEIKRLPEWMRSEYIYNEFYYFIGDAALEIQSDKYGDGYAYFPEPYLEFQKTLWWSWESEQRLYLSLKDNDTIIESSSRYKGVNEVEVDFCCKAFPNEKRPMEREISLEKFCELLDEGKIYPNYLIFKEKLEKAKSTYEENVRKAESERREREAKEKESAKENALNDLSKW